RTHFGCFENHGVAARKRHGECPHSEDDRRVPGGDAEHDARRLAYRQGQAAGHVARDDVPVTWVVSAAASRSMLAASDTLKRDQASAAPVSVIIVSTNSSARAASASAAPSSAVRLAVGPRAAQSG